MDKERAGQRDWIRASHPDERLVVRDPLTPTTPPQNQGRTEVLQANQDTEKMFRKEVVHTTMDNETSPRRGSGPDAPLGAIKS